MRNKPSHKLPPKVEGVKLPSIGSVNRSAAKQTKAAMDKRISKVPNQGRPSLGSVNQSAAKQKKAAMDKRISKLTPENVRPSLGAARKGAAKETASLKKGIKAGATSAGNIKLPSLGSATAKPKPAKKPTVRKAMPKKRKVAKGSGSTGYVMTAPSDSGINVESFGNSFFN